LLGPRGERMRLALTETTAEMQETIAHESVLMEAPPLRVSVLEATALKAALWTFMDYGFGQSLRVVNSLVLTRLLVPAAFGEMALVTTLIVGMNLLSDLGLGPSVIQSRRGDDPHFLNTAWTLQALRGAALWVVSLALAYPAAKFYHDPRLIRLLPVLAFCTFVSGFNSTGLLTLSRHMGLRRLFGVDFSTQIVQLVVTVGLAIVYRSVWALVAGNVAACFYKLAISHNKRVVPGLTNRFCLDRESLADIAKFGKWIVVGTAFYFFASQGDRLILGRLVDMTVLGIYGIAFQISDVPRSVINALSQKVLFPFISKLVHLPMDQFRAQFLRYRMYTLCVGAVLLSSMAVWGNLIILKFYPARYAEASWMIPILALGLWHTLLYTTTGPVLFALGKSTYNAVGNAGYGIAMFAGIPVAFHFFGLFGAIIAIAAGDLPLYFVTQFGATREGVRPLWQDLQVTALLAVCLVVELTLRKTL
jgi:O-antigen/teichoic acid export membrane protein